MPATLDARRWRAGVRGEGSGLVGLGWDMAVSWFWGEDPHGAVMGFSV